MFVSIIYLFLNIKYNIPKQWTLLNILFLYSTPMVKSQLCWPNQGYNYIASRLPEKKKVFYYNQLKVTLGIYLYIYLAFSTPTVSLPWTSSASLFLFILLNLLNGQLCDTCDHISLEFSILCKYLEIIFKLYDSWTLCY